MARLSELFFYLSGEHETLPCAEVKAILEADGFNYRNAVLSPRLLYFESDVKCLQSIASRSCLTKACGIVVLKCGAEREEIMRTVEDTDYSGFARAGETFSVTVTAVTRPDINTVAFERAIGEVISRKNHGLKVKLRYPEVSFQGIVSGDVFILGKRMFEPSKIFLKGKPRRRPFNHPSSMSAKLARVIINLTCSTPGSMILDPFCGTGSLLIEAGLIGCRVVGSDISVDMLRGTALNLSNLNIPQDGLVASDARCMPFTNVERIATDPPYGRASSTHGVSTVDIVSSFLSDALELLPRGGYISIALPNTLNVWDMGEKLGYVRVECHTVREHKSLTREISTFKKC